MHTIHLPATRLDVEVPDNFHYQDHGIVKDVSFHSAELVRKYGEGNAIKIEASFARHLALNPETYGPGRCYFRVWDANSIDEALEKGKTIFCHTYVADNLDYQKTTFFRGHEETHVLARVHKIDILQNALAKINIRANTLTTLPTEAICDIGGIYAILSGSQGQNISLKDCFGEDIINVAKWLSQNSSWKTVIRM